jgi:hypothetical protein
MDFGKERLVAQRQIAFVQKNVHHAALPTYPILA